MRKSLFTVGAILLTSASLMAQSIVETKGKKYTILEDVTGAWNQNAPDNAAAMENVLNDPNNKNIIGVTLHIDDQMSFTAGTLYITDGITMVCGYPMGLVDRKNFGNKYTTRTCRIGTNVPSLNWPDAVYTQSQTLSNWDLKMEHGFNPATRKLQVKLTAISRVNQSGDFNLNVWIVEDSVVGPNSGGYNQANAFNTTAGHPYEGKGNPIVGYVHRNVVRAYLGDMQGMPNIVAKNPRANSSYSHVFEYVLPIKFDVFTNGIPNLDINKVKLVGIINVKSDNKREWEILNAVPAQLTQGVLSVKETPLAQNLSIFPNPTQNVINIAGDLNTSEDIELTIFNQMGQIVKVQKLDNNQSSLHTSIDVSALSNGMYQVVLKSQDGLKHTQTLSIVK
jgi:hypothetical protein